MRRTRVLWEVYVTRFEEALDRYKRHRLSAEEAGELLGLSGRHFRRQCARYASAGIDGLRVVVWPIAANPGAAASPSLRQGNGAGA